ncbi:unnamed protein product, partial [marine sediment metagenome]
MANNREDFPTIGDISFIFDPNKPTKPIFNSEYIFENNTIPFFDEIIFEDDYKLKNVEYRLDFHDQDKWIMINKNNIDADKYITLWNLTKNDWEYMVEDFEYYIYFRITDSLENIYETPSKQDAVKIIKNLQKNVITTPYDPDIWVIRLRADFSANYSSNISGEAILFDWSVTFKQEGDLDYETIFYDN